MLAAFVTGLADSGSYLGMKDVWLAWLDAAAPAPFALFLLGLAVFITGLFSLRIMLPSVYRWGAKPL